MERPDHLKNPIVELEANNNLEESTRKKSKKIILVKVPDAV